jgi:hypothetical protein
MAIIEPVVDVESMDTICLGVAAKTEVEQI